MVMHTCSLDYMAQEVEHYVGHFPASESIYLRHVVVGLSEKIGSTYDDGKVLHARK
jgi:hypothetical protein